MVTIKKLHKTQLFLYIEIKQINTCECWWATHLVG